MLQEGITNLLAFFDKTGRVPHDTQDASKEERRALSTWKTLKNKYPDHPVTKKLMSMYPYGDTKSGRSIKMLVEFEQKWHHLPTNRSKGVEGEKKIYVRFMYLRKKYADHPAVKEILDRYKDFDPRMDINKEAINRIRMWVEAHGHLPKENAKDHEEQRIAYGLRYQKQKHSNLPEIKELLEKYK